MNSCKNCNAWRCGKVLWVIRILTWLAMLIFGVMKLWWWAEGMAWLWSAAPNLLPFLSFLPDIARGWIATIGEILAWLLLISGCGIFVRAGALLTLLIMIFAWNAGGLNPNLILVSLWALIALFCGWGCWKICGPWCPCNKMWWCTCSGGSCKGWSCSTGMCDCKDENCTCADKKSCNCKDGKCTCKIK